MSISTFKNSRDTLTGSTGSSESSRSATSAQTTSGSGDKPSGLNEKKPTMANKRNLTKTIPSIERDGSALHELKDRGDFESSESEDFELPEKVLKRFDDEVAEWTKAAERKKKKEERASGTSSPNRSDSESSESESSDSGSLNSTTKWRFNLRKTKGADNKHEEITVASGEMGRKTNAANPAPPHQRQIASLTPRKSFSFWSAHQDSSDLTLKSLAECKWAPAGAGKSRFSVADRLPLALRKKLAAEYRRLTELESTQNLRVEQRENHLREKLAIKFLFEALLGSHSQFDKATINSRSEINNYLSSSYGFRISGTAEKSNGHSPEENTAREPKDVVSLLLNDAILLSNNYKVNFSADLSNLESDPHLKKSYMTTIEAARKEQKVSEEFASKHQVGSIFARDFEFSTYEFEDVDGSVKTIGNVEEFVNFIDSSGKSRLPWEISIFACQTLGNFIKNYLFSRINDNGLPTSPLKTFDNLPLSISMSPKVTYRLKKLGDGSFVLGYHGAVNTADNAVATKNTASVWSVGDRGLERKAVMTGDSSATTSLTIAFYPNGAFQMGKLAFKAEGWNVIDS